MNGISRKAELLRALMAHGAFIVAVILDGFRRESAGVALYVFSIGSAIFVLPSFIYFAINPRSFFLLPSQARVRVGRWVIGRVQKIAIFLASWIYVVGWSLSWLLFAAELPRLVSSYAFMCGVVTTLFIAKYLFFRSSDEAV
jgi:hypothetical protein